MITHPFAESGITNLRREVKLLLDLEESESVADALAGTARAEESRVVAVYFDTPGGSLALRAATSPDDCVKVRTKAYAPDRSGEPGRVVLEVKRERSGVTSKERLWLPRGEVRDAMGRSLAQTFGALAPIVATSYRRRVYQPGGDWRVTIDDGLTFHEASWALFADDAGEWHDGLGTAFGAEPRVVVELKFGAEGLPQWLAHLGRARGTRYSKFAAAIGLGARGRSTGA